MPSRAQNETIESILGTVAGTVFNNAGEVIILLRDDAYIINVADDGSTSSAYLVTIPPAQIAQAMGADEQEIGGWSTGWEC